MKQARRPEPRHAPRIIHRRLRYLLIRDGLSQDPLAIPHCVCVIIDAHINDTRRCTRWQPRRRPSAASNNKKKRKEGGRDAQSRSGGTDVRVTPALGLVASFRRGKLTFGSHSAILRELGVVDPLAGCAAAGAQVRVQFPCDGELYDGPVAPWLVSEATSPIAAAARGISVEQMLAEERRKAETLLPVQETGGAQRRGKAASSQTVADLLLK